MKRSNSFRMRLVLTGFIGFIVLGSHVDANTAILNQAPIADAGLSRYVAQDAVVLDGTDSYDSDGSSSLTYSWCQTSGPKVTITGADTATPMISGFVQTNAVQKCEIELAVSDGDLTSQSDSVEVIIVPIFGDSIMSLRNDFFDPDKPTVIYFGGGNCWVGTLGLDWSSSAWMSRANVIDFPSGYGPDADDPYAYFHYADMMIVYLSEVAPDYEQPIQTIGWSTGGQPAIDMGIKMNLTYADARYAVNRVTLIDVSGCREHSESISQFRDAVVDNEQCWIDHYMSSFRWSYSDVLNVDSVLGHSGIKNWYRDSITNNHANELNSGVVAGSYWSVIGPGKNLQLAPTTGLQTYEFKWHGDGPSGYMDLGNESHYSARLPGPVSLLGPTDQNAVDASGSVLSCRKSENSVGYQLLFGPNPSQMVLVFSDTPTPPSESVTAFPFEQTWWTVKAYDQYGSTIYADPVFINAASVVSQMVDNVTTGQTYASIQRAINDARPGDEIVVGPGACQYFGNINFKGKNLTLRSIDPTDPAVVAATVINGDHRRSTVTFSSGEEASCVLDGFTITGGTVGISCNNASPTIRNCTIGGFGRNSIEFSYTDDPIIVDCTIFGQVHENDPRLSAHWKLDETEGDVAQDSAMQNDGMVMGEATWLPGAGQIDGAIQLDGINDYVDTPFVLNPREGAFSVFVWIKGGVPGQAIISQEEGANWILTDAQGYLMTALVTEGRRPGDPLLSETVITDDTWHRIGFVWDGSYRSLYVDDELVATDVVPQNNFPSSRGELNIGGAHDRRSSGFWSGLVDDVRIYDRVVAP